MQYSIILEFGKICNTLIISITTRFFVQGSPETNDNMLRYLSPLLREDLGVGYSLTLHNQGNYL
ncbi:MAG: hypothetical protein DRR19_03340 [Candidatus Parabeggiatoa sp. nov. 1]|nr:MAG: hypothetical protein DRR19_03340 [Gammaproteobacteria bacterium]